jgi:hypothetical protein
VGQVSDSSGSDGSFAFSFDVSLELVKTSEVVTAGTLTSSNTQFGLVLSVESLSYPNTSPTQVTWWLKQSPAPYHPNL